MKSRIISDISAGNKERKEIRSTILCVDDEKMMLSVLFEQLTEWFGKNYRIEKALSGEEAIQIVDQCIEDDEPISVVISDYMMPVMKGDELLIEIRKRDPKIRKIMLTGYTSITGIITAINQAGLYRFIYKPWDAKDLMLTIMEAIKSYEQEKKMQELVKGVEGLYRRCEEGTQHAVDALVSTIQEIEPSLASHSMRIRQYSIWLAKKLELDEGICRNLKYASVLHEIGTLGKITKGRDTSQKKQLEDAKKIISHLEDAEQIFKGVQYQFEKYDGSGIFNKKANEIPEEARVIAIVHFYDILKTENSSDLTVNQIVEQLEDRKGTYFDPSYVEEFIKILRPVQ